MTATRRRKAALVVAAVFLLLLAVLALVPLLLRERIDGWLQQAISDQVDAEVAWAGAGISLLRSFPNASLRVDDLSIVGTGSFAGDTLAAVPRLSVTIELPSLLRALRADGPLAVRSVTVDRPAARLLVLEDGARNWEIMRASEETPASEPLELTLRGLAINDARIVYDDREGGVTASLLGLDQQLRGDFRATRFTIDSRTRGDSISVALAGVPMLSNARLEVDTELDVDTDAGVVAVRSGGLRLNDLVLALSGVVGIGEEPEVDLAFDAPGASVHELVSLITPLYAEGGLGQAEAAGTMRVSGWVRGPYGGDAFPALEIDAAIQNGSLRYPDLPLPVGELALDLSVRNPGGDLDSTRVDLRHFRAVAGRSPVEGSFALSTPVSDPAIDMRAVGRLDLEEWGRALPLNGVEEAAGVLEGDIRVQARASDVEAERFDRIVAEGTLDIARFALRSEALPHPLSIEEARFHLSPAFAEVPALRGRIGSSDFDVDGRIDGPLAYAMGDDVLTGSVAVRSGVFDLNEWKSDDELQQIAIPDRVDLTLSAAVDRVVFADLDLRDARGTVRVRDQRATLEDVALDLFGGQLVVDGFYDTSEPDAPRFDVGLGLTSIDIAQAGAELMTMRAFAPVVQYATGRMSTELHLSGALGEDMAPVLNLLSGQGSLETLGLALQGFPGLERLADRLNAEQLRRPALTDITATFHILDGRLHVRPFNVTLGEFGTQVAGSQGIDGTMDYALELQLPRALLGSAANQAVASLVERAAGAGLALEAAEEITLGVALTGTVTEPSIGLDVRGVTGADGVRTALAEGAERRVEAMQERVDSVAAAARLRAEEESLRILAEAERQADALREQARELADGVRREAYERADSLALRGGNALERRLAEGGANRLREEADERADGIVRQADQRADALVGAARERAEQVRSSGAGAGESAPVIDETAAGVQD